MKPDFKPPPPPTHCPACGLMVHLAPMKKGCVLTDMDPDFVMPPLPVVCPGCGFVVHLAPMREGCMLTELDCRGRHPDGSA